MQPDEQEHAALEEKLDRGPVHPLAEPGRRALDERRLVPEDEPGDHDRDHARGVDRLRQQIGGEGRHEGKRRVEHRIGDPLADDAHERRHEEAERDPATCCEKEVEHDAAGGHGAGQGGDGRSQGHERRGIVEERFALENRHDLSRQADASGDGRGGDRIGRRHHRAQGDTRGERDIEKPPGDGSDGNRRADDQSHRKKSDRPPVRFHVDERRADRRGVEQRRKEADQHQIGAQVGLGDEREERRRKAHDRQGERRRELEPKGEAGDRRDRDAEDENRDRYVQNSRPMYRSIWRFQYGQSWPPSGPQSSTAVADAARRSTSACGRWARCPRRARCRWPDGCRTGAGGAGSTRR